MKPYITYIGVAFTVNKDPNSPQVYNQVQHITVDLKAYVEYKLANDTPKGDKYRNRLHHLSHWYNKKYSKDQVA